MNANSEQGGDGVSDADALARVRAGDLEAFSVVYRRHRSAAFAAARTVVDPSTAEDAVQVGFLQVLHAVRAGRGPRQHVRAYINTSVRRAAGRIGPRGSAFTVEADESLEEPADPPERTVLDRLLLAEVFGSLPERWRQILWMVYAEGRSLSDVGPRLGVNESAAAALAYRAREGLRTAWLDAHVNAAGAPEGCRRVLGKLAAWQRGKLSARGSEMVASHVENCSRCQEVAVDLTHASARLNQAGRARCGGPQATSESYRQECTPAAEPPSRLTVEAGRHLESPSRRRHG